MRHITNQTMELQHARYVLDLYRELHKKNIGTNAIEHLAKAHELPHHLNPSASISLCVHSLIYF